MQVLEYFLHKLLWCQADSFAVPVLAQEASEQKRYAMLTLSPHGKNLPAGESAAVAS